MRGLKGWTSREREERGRESMEEERKVGCFDTLSLFAIVFRYLGQRRGFHNGEERQFADKTNNGCGLVGGSSERGFIRLIVCLKMHAQVMNDLCFGLSFPVFGVLFEL